MTSVEFCVFDPCLSLNIPKSFHSTSHDDAPFTRHRRRNKSDRSQSYDIVKEGILITILKFRWHRMDILSIDNEFNIKINRDYVLGAISDFKLGTVLMQHRKSMLMQKAVSHEIVGRSKMNKLDLVSVLAKTIISPDALQETIILLDEDEYNLYQELMHSASSCNMEVFPYKLRFLIDRGILYCIFHGDYYEYFIPLEVKEALAELDWNYIYVTREYQHKILKYVKSAVNLYGFCKPDLVTDIYNSHHENTVTVQELTNICRFHSKNIQSFYEYNGYMISNYFEEEYLNEFDALLIKAEGKPYYIPNKEIFSRYADSLYYEITPQLLKLKLFIRKELCQSEEIASLLMDEIQLICSMEAPIQQVVDELTRRGVVLNNYDQLQKLASLMVDVYNHTRLWSNRGHTPAELNPTINDRISNDVKQHINPIKIGRNEPCFCGSGNKFKKCCGK